MKFFGRAEAARRINEREWNNAQQNAMRRQVNERLRQQYSVVIEWPYEKASSDPSGEDVGS